VRGRFREVLGGVLGAWRGLGLRWLITELSASGCKIIHRPKPRSWSGFPNYRYSANTLLFTLYRRARTQKSMYKSVPKTPNWGRRPLERVL
jgi:hypothetical protein